jgi:hypothetical protein
MKWLKKVDKKFTNTESAIIVDEHLVQINYISKSWFAANPCSNNKKE